MFRNIHYDYNKSEIYVYEQIKGERLFFKEQWVPYVFIKSNEDTKDCLAYDGTPVRKKKFNTYYEYKSFCKDKEHLLYEARMKPEIQYLVDRYNFIPDNDLETPTLKIFSFDIETHIEGGREFPNTQEAKGVITCATVYDSLSKEFYTFGIKPYSGKYKKNYKFFKKETDLLLALFKFIAKEVPDVITGWNVFNYDFPYLVQRCKNLFGEENYKDILKEISPIKQISSWYSKNENQEILDIGGISILDLMSLYKRYSTNKVESYSLEFVSNFELDKGKLNYSEEATSLNELYEKNWETYVDYNVIDTKRVMEIDNKCGFIKQIQALSLLTKCPMKFAEKQTSLIEGSLLTYLRRRNMCAPVMKGGITEEFEAAFVKDPQIGKHEWVVDMDVTSEYPTQVITMNMSTETYYGIIKEKSEEEIIASNKLKQYQPFTLEKADGKIIEIENNSLNTFNRAIEGGLFSIAPNGSIFKTSKPGIIASFQREFFQKRKDVKGLMFEQKKLGNTNEAEKLNRLQSAIKTILNSTYGATSVVYSRYFNINISKAITAGGRHTLRNGEKFLNEILNNPTDELKLILEEIKKYSDTA